MRTTRIVGCLALVAVALAYAAWRVEAGDGKPTVEDRVAALEAKVAALQAKVAALAPPAPATQSRGEPSKDSDPKAMETLRAIKVTVHIQDRPMREVLRTVADIAKVNMIVAPNVGDAPVTLAVEDMDFTVVLRMLAASGGFRWTVENYGVIRIQ